MDAQSLLNNEKSSFKLYPIETSKKKSTKKKKSKNRITNYIKNPSITHFNIDSHFIYSEEDFMEYYTLNQNRNLIKLNKNELDFLTNKINEINLISNIDEINDYIELDEEITQKLIKFKPLNNNEDEVNKFIMDKIRSSENRDNISCRKLSALYLKETGKFICKSSIHKLMKNKLGLHYLKTCK